MSTSFSDLGINKELSAKLSELNIIEPTAVQQKIIPLVADGKNILYQSETGTGKTFAYLLPLIQKILLQEDCSQNKKIEILVVSPTLELASQIRDQIKLVSNIKTALFIGGSPINRQIEALKEKPVIVIGGPARLLELIHLKKLKVDSLKALILDEADRLLSPELRGDTEGLINRLPKNVQLIGNSATVSTYTKKTITEARIKDDIELVELPPEDILRKRIEHWALFAETRDKIDTLRSFIHAVNPEKLIVFTSRFDQVENIVQKLRWKHIDCEGLSAKSDKKDRKAAFDKFKSGKAKILITTDVSARGIDIQDITHVVQMDLPEQKDFFIHRAGRTGRAGKNGCNCVIGDSFELQRYASFEKSLGITVYPKALYNGKLVSNTIDTEAESVIADREDGHELKENYNRRTKFDSSNKKHSSGSRKSYNGERRREYSSHKKHSGHGESDSFEERKSFKEKRNTEKNFSDRSRDNRKQSFPKRRERNSSFRPKYGSDEINSKDNSFGNSSEY